MFNVGCSFLHLDRTRVAALARGGRAAAGGPKNRYSRYHLSGVAELAALPSFQSVPPDRRLPISMRCRCAAARFARAPDAHEYDGKLIVKRMSHTKRLVLGLGLMGLCLVAALPFRHTSPPATTLVADAADNQLSLGEGVSLQMPGQTMTVPLPTQPRPPFPAEAEQPAEPPLMAELSVQEDVSALTKPPALADQYRPLFKPVASTDNSGRVLPLGPQPTPPAKPLKRHTIHDGDTLESLAVRYLGDSQRAAEILQLNRNVLSDPELLPIGMTIVIPPAAATARTNQTATTAGDTPSLVPLPTEGYRRGR